MQFVQNLKHYGPAVAVPTGGVPMPLLGINNTISRYTVIKTSLCAAWRYDITNLKKFPYWYLFSWVVIFANIKIIVFCEYLLISINFRGFGFEMLDFPSRILRIA